MPTHRPHNGGSSRVVFPAADILQNTSSRLPTRSAAISASASNSGTSSPSKLVKKRPSTSTRRGVDPPFMNSRSPPLSGVRRLTGQELRRELAEAGKSAQSRYTNAMASPPSVSSRSNSRPLVSEPARTPSLVSGSSASTQDSPRSNRLRRKHSNVGKQHLHISPDSSSSRDESGQGYKDPYPDAVLGIAMPPVSSGFVPRDPHDDIIHLDQYADSYPNRNGGDLPHPAPLYAMSTSTPSTGYSPGPFSISSTPTSMSSASPGFVSSTALRTKQPSPSHGRALATRTYVEDPNGGPKSRGLAPVRESSSSSTSTLRGGESIRSRSRSRVKPMPAPSPSPPPEVPVTSHHRRGSSGTKNMYNRVVTTENGQVLPEFAHLVDSSPRKGSIGGSVPPARPSRDGAPEIFVQQRSPVVQSNMTSLPTSLHKRQSSSDAKRAIPPPLTVDTSKTRFGIPRGRTVSPSPSQGSALSPRTTAAPTRGFTPDYPSESETSSRIRPSPIIASKPFSSRFGFFSKKDKNDPSTTAAPKEKKTRKGPAAGTGHEAYHRFIRGRSGSTTSSSGTTNIGRSPSADSAIGTVPPRSRKSSFGSKNGSNSDFEDFVSEREKPIAIRGGQARPAIERSQSDVRHASQDAARDTQFVAPSWNSSEASLGPPMRPILLPSPMSDPQMAGSPMKRDTSAMREQKSALSSLSSLTSRRTSRRSFLGGKALATAQQAESEAQGRKASESSELGKQINDMLNDTQASLKPPSKWNFLQRSKSPGRQATPAPIMDAPLPSRPIGQRSVAHYAMLNGSPPKALDADELQKIMQEAENSTPEDASNSETEQKLRARKKGKVAPRQPTMLLPDPPKFSTQPKMQKRAPSPKVMLNTAAPPPQRALPEQPQATPASPPQAISIVGQPRPSRLPQVGRIPRVVSKRDRERKLPDNSFSRPFMPAQPSPALKNGPMSPVIVSSPESLQAGFSAIPELAMASATKGMQTPSDDLAMSPHFSPPLGFMNFSRKDSGQSSRSSGSAYFNVLATTAMIPAPDAPFSDDEIWGEYDDIEDMFSGKQKMPKTPMTGSSMGAPFQYSELSPKDAANLQRPSTAPADNIEIAPEVPKVPTLATFAQQIRIPSMHDSRIVSGLPSAGSPNSPFRMSDFVGSYGERNLSVIDPISGRLSLMPSNSRLSSSTNGRYSLPATIRPQSSQQTLPATRHNPTKSQSSGRDSRIMERAETEYMGFENLANLRFGALMTSKWLSFGRVLFSPAHTELNTKGEHRVLVLDGLGKDWSFYVALNYPNASVYNLGTDESSEQSNDAANPIQSLPNHRHIHHPSLRDPFPFPKGFFAAVVFRFPVATTEFAYKSAIYECKRVLRPGGYLEISALDMDMMNMGSRGRRALRSMKTQIQAEDSTVSLKPLSDTFQRLLYRRGFENLNRCFVGIPCAGRIPGSRDEGNTPEPQSASVESSNGSSKRMDEDMPSFGDLFLSQGQAGDEGVTKMVSKVGRWWYSRCYESLILPNGDITKSIWTDDALVRECEKRSTNLKLMICYAQKPGCPVRRTISV